MSEDPVDLFDEINIIFIIDKYNNAIYFIGVLSIIRAFYGHLLMHTF